MRDVLNACAVRMMRERGKEEFAQFVRRTMAGGCVLWVCVEELFGAV